MKIKIVAGYNEVFEKEYKGKSNFKTSNQLSKLFEYTFQYKIQLLKQLNDETNIVKQEIIKAKIKDIEKILIDNQDLSTFLHYDATAL